MIKTVWYYEYLRIKKHLVMACRCDNNLQLEECDLYEELSEENNYGISNFDWV